jgi:hypothetical protein
MSRLHVGEIVHQLGPYATTRVDAGTGKLFGGGEIEQHVGLDQGLGGLVQQRDLLVGVAVPVLHVQVVRKVLRERERVFVGLGELVVKWDVFYPSLCTLLAEPLGAQHACRGVSFLPSREVQVVLDVGRDYVADFAAEGFHGRFGCGRQGDWGEDGEVAGAQLDEGCAPAELDFVEAQEGDGERGEVLVDGAGVHCGVWCRHGGGDERGM